MGGACSRSTSRVKAAEPAAPLPEPAGRSQNLSWQARGLSVDGPLCAPVDSLIDCCLLSIRSNLATYASFEKLPQVGRPRNETLQENRAHV